MVVSESRRGMTSQAKHHRVEKVMPVSQPQCKEARLLSPVPPLDTRKHTHAPMPMQDVSHPRPISSSHFSHHHHQHQHTLHIFPTHLSYFTIVA